MEEFPDGKVPEDKNSFFKSVRNYFREYCRCTSIHGFRYFGEKRTIFERVWWFVIFVICLAACTTSIYAVYKKWERSPVIVTFATRATLIYNIPFPSVTVCPESKSVQKIFNFTKILQKKEENIRLTPLESTRFEYMSLICNFRDYLDFDYNQTVPDEFYDVIDSLKPEFEIWDCHFMGRPTDCDALFIPLITDEGICYTFNMLDRSEVFRDNVIHYQNYHQIPYRSTNWSLEHGYAKDAGISTYPKRALLAGATNGLRFKILTPKVDLDYACKDSLQGYKVLLHTAMRMPRPSQQYFRIPLDQSVVGAVQPVMITTSESVKVYNPKKRECYFPSERHLKYFKIYTSLNCMMECLTNYTFDNCGCVNFFMPRENGTQVCGTYNVECMKEAEADMQMKNLKRKLNKPKHKRKKKKGKVDCDCMPICADLTYDVETSQTDWDWEKQKKANRKMKQNYSKDNLHMSSLTIFFKSNNFITSQRNELYGPTDFLANFGGLLGLFTGFSVLSLMEILYFLTVRMICNTRLYGYWAGPET
ncbi:pickpocket protein 28 [Asbolus verrucosus]|uniref:Pickpocket protein 28 n=1 Tax=Asbolus verrucosus TaxID=1661398 RepID=A0A482VWK3_ASBVE|nr:pickpocket protein 28 [Asbolus verrucosus]